MGWTIEMKYGGGRVARAGRSQMLGRRQEEKETLDALGVALVEGR